MPKPVVQVGDDPDPSEWLLITLEQKRIDQSKPYDAKKACWVPDEKEGFVLGEIKATKGELVTVGLPEGGVMHIVSNFLAQLLESRTHADLSLDGPGGFQHFATTHKQQQQRFT